VWFRHAPGTVEGEARVIVVQPQLDLCLPPGLEAPGAARRCVDAFDRYVGNEVTEDARLLVSELVTNAIIHTEPGPESCVEVRVETASDRLRVEVASPGPRFEVRPAEPPDDAVSGRGLFLVDRIADRWGLIWDGWSRVWFELALPGAARRAERGRVGS